MNMLGHNLAVTVIVPIDDDDTYGNKVAIEALGGLADHEDLSFYPTLFLY